MSEMPIKFYLKRFGNIIDVKKVIIQKIKSWKHHSNLTRELTNQGYAFAEVDVQTNQNADKVQFCI